MDNISKEIETLRKNPKEMLEIPNLKTDRKNTCDKLIHRVDKSKERISELQERSLETTHMNLKTKQTKKHRTSKNYGTV